MITIQTKKITESTAGFCDIIDITKKLHEHIREAHIRAGTATLFLSGSTAALTTIEHEAGLVRDLKEFVETQIPSDRRYHHDDRWGDDNGFSHLRAALSGRHWRFPSWLACSAWAPGSRSCCLISIIDRAIAKSSSSS